MTLLSLPVDTEACPSETAPRRVTLLSGFLGSGKTTLLRRELDRVGGHTPTVILNDFSQTLVDDVLLSVQGNRLVAVSGGCICCNRREELAQALLGLLDAEQRGGSPRRDHVIIETSGLSDPGPIAFTVANDSVLKHHYVLARICVTVDALTGLGSLEHHEVAQRQLLAADDLLITKADLVQSKDIEHLVARLHELNPAATISITANGELLRVEAACITTRRDPWASPAADVAHTKSISTLELVSAKPLDWQAFSTWLSLLLHRHGPDILRVKGIVHVREVGPVALNGVQHVMHHPEHLAGPTPLGTRLVLIVRGIDTGLLERSFHTFVAMGRE